MCFYFVLVFAEIRRKPRVDHKRTERGSIGFKVYFITVPQNNTEFDNRANKNSRAAAHLILHMEGYFLPNMHSK